jgi:Fur family ferric uptake transcriptional regulator
VGSETPRKATDETIESLERLCRVKRIAFTVQRRIVLETLLAAPDHPSAFDIRDRISRRYPISLATIYRTLNTLADAGILKRRLFGDGKARYEIPGRTAHPHLIDVATGKIVEVDDTEIAALIAKVAQRLGYRLVDYRLELLAAGSPA